VSTLDGNNLFGSGPHSLRPLAWQRQIERRSFPGVDGELVLDMGMRSRRIVQQGRLQADTAAARAALVAAIEQYADGLTHALVDNHGRTHSPVILESFEPTTPLQQGRGYWCDYVIHYLQLP
jgi:hypothetical protein